MAEKTKKAPAEVTETIAPEDNSPVTAEDEAAAMKEQVAYQLAQLLKMADKMGIKLDEVFPKPPSAVTTVTEAPSAEAIANIAAQAAVAATRAMGPQQAQPQLTPDGKLKPGQALPGGAWVQWKKDDLDPEDVVTFVPLPIPGMVYPFADELGYQKIKLDINGLVCWLTCGVENTINRFFYNVYEAGLANHRELEAFKRNGPAYAPWGTRGPDGRPAWQYTPMAPSFGMNVDGHSLRIGGPTPLDMTPSEIAAAPAPPAEEPQS